MYIYIYTYMCTRVYACVLYTHLQIKYVVYIITLKNEITPCLLFITCLIHLIPDKKL